MTVSDSTIGQIASQVTQLPFGDQLRLIRLIIDALVSPLGARQSQRGQPQRLVYGQFRGVRMSTEDDFCLAEWRPTEMELDGA